MYFRNYRLRKECLPKCLNGFFSEHPLAVNISEGSQKLLKSAWQHFHHVFSPHLGKLSWKMSLLAISEILGLFIKTLIADHSYCLCNMENITQPIQMQLSKKQKKLLLFCFISENASYFQHFEKIDEPQSRCNSNIIDWKRRGYLNV